MSDADAIHTPDQPAPRRRGPAARKHLWVDGVEYLPRDELADQAGISHRTGARLFKRVSFIANIAYVPKEASLRDLVGLNEPQRPARTTRRGPHRTK